MSYHPCDKKTCINWVNGNCSIKDPEKTENSCLDFEDAMDSLRLRADAIKGALG